MKRTLAFTLTLLATQAWAHESPGITSAKGNAEAAFDLVHTRVYKQGDNLVFEQLVDGKAGSRLPTAKGAFAGAEVYSYVWPTSLDSSSVGFDAKAGILALALTSHPDFDDTPKLDENRDGKADNDGGLWHSHWVVLSKDESCGPGGLKVRDIPEGAKPTLPATWPGAPIYIDSPGYDLSLDKNAARISVPLAAVGFPQGFNYDGVTAALKINADLHNPLLCVSSVWDVSSGDLSLPGRWTLNKQ
ncbi:hypothetical protein D3C77_03750 [compost metagenome]|uniref:hypothetical protein n=1 Tax=Pseudomonas TaxID=286 RepID=UPI000CFD01D4|nr:MULTISPECIES: hypothetical protein [unclassified Pseudomonas]MCW2271135.1 hypothetical protein [Pseudomonas sp. JUb96]PRA58081.1 hypothetical protein CQ065_23665 [Pseudomonas sp. MYb187]